MSAPGTRANIWLAWVGDHAADVDRFSRGFLSAEECNRLDAYRSREAAERYVVTRSLVRIVLGELLGVVPRDVRISRTVSGKPVVAEGIHFNVSHSGELVLLAVSSDRPVGVDVERRRQVQRVDALVSRWLTLAERQEVERLTVAGASGSDAFLRVWSLKEARLKALGVGIAGASGASIGAVDAQSLDGLLGSLARDDGDGYVGAVAFA